MHKLEDYVDAQHGGPGKGWYRIVTNPGQAREVINAGKMAVVMGIETSRARSGARQKLGAADLRRSKASIDRQLDEVHKMGVVQMELVNKFDNALSGVAGDDGLDRLPGQHRQHARDRVALADADLPSPTTREVHDKDQDNSVAGRLGRHPGAGRAVRRGREGLRREPARRCRSTRRKHHCNTLGLTDARRATRSADMAKRHMIFDPDHMSVKARKSSLDLIE